MEISQPFEMVLLKLIIPSFATTAHNPPIQESSSFPLICFHLHKSSVACAVGPSVTTSSTDFSFQNLVLWNLFEFSVAEIT